MIKQALEIKLPPFDMVDLVEEDEDLFIPVVGVKLEIGIAERAQVREADGQEPVIFKINVDDPAAANGRCGVGAEMVDQLMDKVRLAATPGTGYDDN